jgi:4-amino-4-deoxy-L-arabinose transferase-like glycosyltransferase
MDLAAGRVGTPKHIDPGGLTMSAQPSPPITLPAILLGAFVLRWGYALTLYVTMGDGGLTGLDSMDYLRYAQAFAANASDGNLSGWQWLGPNLHMMPFFTWLLAGCFAISGTQGPLLYVLVQGAADTWTCLLVHRIAFQFDSRFAIPSAIAAAVNPTQIVMAGLVYSDTPFVTFVALSVLASLRWLAAPTARNATLIGIGLGAAALFRALIVPWGIASIAFLATVALLRRQFRMWEVRQLAVATIILALAVTPILLRNHAQYGALSLTPQGGMHLTRWIVPLVKEAKDGTPWDQTYALMEKRTEERFGLQTNNPFENSRRYIEIGNEAMREMGLLPAIKAWAYGAAINMASPALLISPPVSQLPRTGFFATPGANMAEKIFNFVFRSDNARYAQLLLVGIAGVALIGLIQLAGLLALWRTSEIAALLFCAALIGYVLAINGPVASPKYRLPVEPILNVLTGAGFALLTRRKTV